MYIEALACIAKLALYHRRSLTNLVATNLFCFLGKTSFVILFRNTKYTLVMNHDTYKEKKASSTDLAIHGGGFKLHEYNCTRPVQMCLFTKVIIDVALLLCIIHLLGSSQIETLN